MDNRKTKIANIMSHFRLIKRRFAPVTNCKKGHPEVSMTQASVLILIKKNGSISISELAHELGFSKSAATQLIDNLIRQNLVTRKIDQKDKRVIKVELSKTSEKHFLALRNKMLGKVTAVFDSLSDEELGSLEKITEKISKVERGANK